MKRRVLIALALWAWGSLVFAVALHVHFPGDAALERARYEVEEASKGSMAIDASSSSLYWMTGVNVDDLVVYTVEKKRKKRKKKSGDDGDDDEPKVNPLFRLESAHARVPLLPLLLGNRQVDFGADIYGGALSGSASEGGARRALSLEGEDIDLSRIPMEGSDWSVEATGMLKLAAELDLDQEDVEGSTGDLRLEIANFAIQSAKVMGMELTPATFTEAELELEIKDGKATITSGQFTSDMVEISLAGDATLSAKAVGKWRIRVEAAVKLDETLDRFAKMAPGMKDARDKDGVYHMLCTGTLSSPRCREDRSAAGNGTASSRTASSRSASTRKSGGRSSSSRPSVKDDSGKTLTADERREARLERIRERRERMREKRENDTTGDGPPDRLPVDEFEDDGGEFDDNARDFPPPPRGMDGRPMEFEPDDYDTPPDYLPPQDGFDDFDPPPTDDDFEDYP